MVMNFDALLRFYARKDIQNEILKTSKDREVAVMYANKGFGKRPDTLQYPSDVFELARRGATSFHISEERWENPLSIKTGMSRKELNSIRTGWDCVFDIDSPYVEYSQITTHLIVEALKFYGIKSYGIKFSGRKGFHIIIPFEALPKIVNNKPIENLFPEGPRMIAEFLNKMIHEKLSETILSNSTINDISRLTKKPLKDLQMPDGKFNPFSVVDIDTILISSRHLFRSVYSVNEKSGLISVPINSSQINKFKLKQAKIENVNLDIPFIKKAEPEEAKHLVIQAFDGYKEKTNTKKSTIVVEGKDYFSSQQKTQKDFEEIKIEFTNIKEEHIPPCIQQILAGLKEDGRKRALFILINYFKCLNFPAQAMKEKIMGWNQKNYEPLREGYIIAQLNWSARQKDKILPPNCSNDSYFKGMGICHSDNLCAKLKNPVNYTMLKLKMAKNNRKKRAKKTKK
jgi:hypothetical protein